MKEYDNRPFYVTIESVILMNKNLTNTDKIVYSIISAFSNNKNGYCYLKVEQIASLCGIKVRNLLYCLNRLKNEKYIQYIKKNTRTYYQPTLNATIQLREKRKKDRDYIDYDWLEEE